MLLLAANSIALVQAAMTHVRICGIWEDRAEERKKVVVLRELHRAIIYTTR
jgi:hypothetical protein